MTAMRSREYLDFVRDRVIAEIRAHPSPGPLLWEGRGGRQRSERCQRGHTEMVTYNRRRRCAACERIGRDGRPRA